MEPLAGLAGVIEARMAHRKCRQARSQMGRLAEAELSAVRERAAGEGTVIELAIAATEGITTTIEEVARQKHPD